MPLDRSLHTHTPHEIERALQRYVAGLLTDDDAELDLPIRLRDCGGITTGSFGPMMAEVAFMKMIGSAGIFIFASAAWSR